MILINIQSRLQSYTFLSNQTKIHQKKNGVSFRKHRFCHSVETLRATSLQTIDWKLFPFAQLLVAFVAELGELLGLGEQFLGLLGEGLHE